VVSQLISRHYVNMAIYQDKCDELGLSATLRHNQLRIRRLQVRILPSAPRESPGEGLTPAEMGDLLIWPSL